MSQRMSVVVNRCNVASRVREYIESLPKYLPFGSRTTARLLSRLLSCPGRRVQSTVFGLLMNLDLSMEYERELYFGLYERATVRILLLLLEPGGLFIDVGANIGYFSLLASRIVGKEGVVVAFEPDPANVCALRENIALNARGSPVEVRPVALSSFVGTARFVTGEHGVGSTIETSNGAVARLGPEYVGAEKRTIEVQVTTLDRECLALLQRWSGLKIIKIDIEGSEPSALEGAQCCLKLIDAVVIEQNPFMLNVHGFPRNRVVQLMLKSGFCGFLIGERLGRPRLSPVDERFEGAGNMLFVTGNARAKILQHLGTTSGRK